MDKREIIKLIIYSLLTIGGILTLVFARDFAVLNFVPEYCQTFPMTMLTLARWLIIPVGIIATSFFTLIPDLFLNEKLSKVFMIIEFLALLGLGAYLTFFVNQLGWPDLIILKVFTIILYIINFIALLAWFILMILIPALIMDYEEGIAMASFFVLVLSAFLLACSAHLSSISQTSGKLTYSFIGTFVSLFGAGLPIFFSYTTVKEEILNLR